MYNCASGSHCYLEVEDIDEIDYYVEIEAYDLETGQCIYLQMDD